MDKQKKVKCPSCLLKGDLASLPINEKLKWLPTRTFDASEEKYLLSEILVNNITVFNLKGPGIPELFDYFNLAVFINIANSRLISIPWRASCSQTASPGTMSTFKNYLESCQDSEPDTS